ncbi:MAG: riboflavin biosynthesis protein RibF [Synergistaceae bacterium]|jgi:riboflavin kinase/FMN adenylyltransferase|nr:riboflavin biosynthesis protein RibF [Synergistaceae bacterium]
MIAAIGAFDGFHRGHRALLERARARAGENGGSWGVVTFTRHPDRLFTKFSESETIDRIDSSDIDRSGKSFKSLFTAREQMVLEKFFSVPEVRRINFTREIAAMSPDEFLDLIGERFSVDGIVVGEDFRFAKDRIGTPKYLVESCATRGWFSDIVPMFRDGAGGTISSTAIRKVVSLGEMRRAWELLGYPFFFKSRVVHGNSRGAALGFPTANVEIYPEKIDVRGGVYATLVRCGGKWLAGAANIGFNPTFGDVAERRFEVNLIGYGGDLYGREIAVFMLEHIRDEFRFKSAEDLTAQIAKDTAAINSIASALQSHKELWEAFENVL